MTGVRFDLKGDEATLKALDDAIAKTDNKKKLFDNIGAALVTSTQHRFETETGPDGKVWPESLRKRLNGGHTLTLSSILNKSVTHEASDDRVAVGTNVPYAAIHQLGGTIRAKTSKGLKWRAPGNGGWVRKMEVTMPARPYLGLDDDDNTEITAQVAEFLGAENRP